MAARAEASAAPAALSLLEVTVGVARKAVAAFERIEVIPRPVVKLTGSGFRIHLFRATRGHSRLRICRGLVYRLLAHWAFRNSRKLLL